MTVNLQNLRQMPPLRQYNFELIIPSWPGGGDGSLLRIPVLTTSLPGFSSEPIESMVAGFTEKFAGRGMFPRSLPVEYRETRTVAVWSALYDWNQMAFDSETGVQSEDIIGSGYRTTGYLKLYNEARDEVKSITFEGMWPEDVSDVSLDGSASDVVRVSATFSYDRFTIG